MRIPGLSRAASLLVTREFVYFMRTPAVLYQLAVLPLFAFVMLVLSRKGGSPLLPFGVVGSSSFSGQNLTLFGYDGPGVRNLFLLPLSPRDVVLAKGVGFLLLVVVQGVVLVGGLAWLGALHGWLPTVALGYLALAFVATAAGTWFSIRNPVRPPERGLGRRSATGPAGLLAWLLSLVAVAAIGALVWLARAYAPEPWRPFAGLAAAALCAAGGAGIWWISLERNAASLVANRERMLDVLTRAAP